MSGEIRACADAVAGLADVSVPGAQLLPPVSDLRRVSVAVAVAVATAGGVATTAAGEGLAQVELDEPGPAGARGDVAAGPPDDRGGPTP